MLFISYSLTADKGKYKKVPTAEGGDSRTLDRYGTTVQDIIGNFNKLGKAAYTSGGNERFNLVRNLMVWLINISKSCGNTPTLAKYPTLFAFANVKFAELNKIKNFNQGTYLKSLIDLTKELENCKEEMIGKSGTRDQVSTKDLIETLNSVKPPKTTGTYICSAAIDLIENAK